MADLSSLAVQLQRFLKEEGHYKKGPLDGVVGPQMRSAMVSILNEYKIPNAKWTHGRRLIAVEQLYFKKLKLYSGPIDGWDGQNTDYAKEQWAAKKVTTWRDTVEETIKAVPGTVVTTVKAPVTPPATKMKWPTQSQCGSFYGGVGTNQVTAIMPYEMCLAWDTKTKITKWSCHKKVKEPIERIFGRTLDHYGYEKIKEMRLHYWGGTLNVRKMRGGSSWSMHSWGIAVDMDPDRNQLKWGRDRAVFAKPEYKKFWEFVYDEGAISLGIERNYDWMHFQFARL
jgi:hypothetical protein